MIYLYQNLRSRRPEHNAIALRNEESDASRTALSKNNLYNNTRTVKKLR